MCPFWVAYNWPLTKVKVAGNKWCVKVLFLSKYLSAYQNNHSCQLVTMLHYLTSMIFWCTISQRDDMHCFPQIGLYSVMLQDLYLSSFSFFGLCIKVAGSVFCQQAVPWKLNSIIIIQVLNFEEYWLPLWLVSVCLYNLHKRLSSKGANIRFVFLT